MSVSLSNAFVTLFDAEVKQAYQAKAMLVGAVRQRRGVEGSTVKFPKVGKGVATARITQTDVTPMLASLQLLAHCKTGMQLSIQTFSPSKK